MSTILIDPSHVMSFECDVLGWTVEAAPMAAGDWRGARRLLWRYRLLGPDVPGYERRCGFDLAIAGAWYLANDYSMALASFDAAWEMPGFEEAYRPLLRRWDAHLVECRRISGDPTLPLLPPLAAEPQGFVYLVRSAGSLKIGFTSSYPTKRLASLQTGSAARLHLVYWFPALRSEERALHAYFRRHRRHGEWFNDKAEIREAFAQVMADRLGAGR